MKTIGDANMCMSGMPRRIPYPVNYSARMF
jgi:hypothetical protein